MPPTLATYCEKIFSSYYFGISSHMCILCLQECHGWSSKTLQGVVDDALLAHWLWGLPWTTYSEALNLWIEELQKKPDGVFGGWWRSKNIHDSVADQRSCTKVITSNRYKHKLENQYVLFQCHLFNGASWMITPIETGDYLWLIDCISILLE